MPTSIVRPLQDEDAWVRPASLVTAAGFAGWDSWLRFVRAVYGFAFYRFAIEGDHQEAGLLALVHVRHPVFGSYVTSAPFASYGGFAFATIESRDRLLARAKELGQETKADYVSVRFDAGGMTPPVGWVQHPAYATYLAPLDRDPDSMLGSYGADHRNHIRKSLRKGFSIRFGNLELLDDAYAALSRSMHELGSPYHSKGYLRAMAESLGSSLEFAVVHGPREELAGAGVFILDADVVSSLHANILRRFRQQHAGEFLYWSVISRYGQEGFRCFDMGRSLVGSGNEAFKSKWKPERRALAYWFALARGGSPPVIDQHNPRFRLATSLWKRLPAFIVEPLGPLLIRGVA